MKAYYYTKSGAMYSCKLVQCDSCRIIGVRDGTDRCLEFHVASDNSFDKKPQIIFGHGGIVGQAPKGLFCRHCFDKMGLYDNTEEC